MIMSAMKAILFDLDQTLVGIIILDTIMKKKKNQFSLLMLNVM